jgi:hypothetical protein
MIASLFTDAYGQRAARVVSTLEGDLYSCFWLRNGRFLRVEGHLTLAGALHALGVSGDSLEAAGLRE